jgi:hypothetical protein
MKTKHKQQPQHPARSKKRDTRTVIVSFRLREEEAKLLQDEFKNTLPRGLKSLKQFARKLSVDYARQKLVYVDPAEREISDSARDYATTLIPPNCEMSHRRFLRALRDFLNVPENWSKLRYFMLRAGWPQDLLEANNGTTDPQERLLIAQKVLTRMLKKL